MRRNDEVSATAQRYVVRTRRTAGGKVYNLGAEITAEACGRNFRAWLANHDIEPAQNGVALTGSVVDLPVSAAKPNPQPVIVDTGDPVSDWFASKAATVAACKGNSGLAMDLMMGVPALRELYKLASRIGTESERVRRKLQSLTPTQCGF
jgi:hypothetical protein